VSLLADLPDRFRSEVLDLGQATDVKVTHGGLVDRADRVKVLHHFVKRPERGAPRA